MHSSPRRALPESAREDVEFIVEAKGGRVADRFAHRVTRTRHWRAGFDVAAESTAPVHLRGHLRLGDRPLTETWVWQYHPFE